MHFLLMMVYVKARGARAMSSVFKPLPSLLLLSLAKNSSCQSHTPVFSQGHIEILKLAAEIIHDSHFLTWVGLCTTE